MPLMIRSLTAEDYDDWRAIWEDSVAEEEGVLADDAIEATWQQLTTPKADDTAGIYGLLACEEETGYVLGLLHYVVHPVAGAAQPVCYLQDLFVEPAMRRRGAGRELLQALKDEAAAKSWERIYWLVKQDDQRAADFYEGQSIEVPFTVHMHPTRLLAEHEQKQDKERKLG